MHTHIHYNYSIKVMRNNLKKKKKNFEEHCRIKVDIKCVFLFLLNSKTKYTSQTLTVNYTINKTYKSKSLTLISKS